jgi:hypothetical protein
MFVHNDIQDLHTGALQSLSWSHISHSSFVLSSHLEEQHLKTILKNRTIVERIFDNMLFIIASWFFITGDILFNLFALVNTVKPLSMVAEATAKNKWWMQENDS